MRGFSVFFFNSKNTNLTLDFEKQLRLHARFFLSSSYGFVINLKWGQGNWVCVCVCVCVYNKKLLARACGHHPCLLEGACCTQTTSNVVFQGGIRCASPLPSRWWGICAETIHGGALAGGFSLPPSFSSLLLENRASHCKKRRKFDSLFVKLN